MHAKFWIVSDFPTVLKQDEQNRPHSLTGPFCRWSDGWSLYAIRGVGVPAAWVERPAELNPETVLSWPNIEQRRIAAEIVGWSKVLDHCKARIIDENANPQIGTLLEADLPDAPGERFLKVLCGTKRVFVLPVPKTCTTALAANAWTYNVTEAQLLEMEKRT